MSSKLIPYNFTIPKDILESLRNESKIRGVSVSCLIKMRITADKKYFENTLKKKEVIPNVE